MEVSRHSIPVPGTDPIIVTVSADGDMEATFRGHVLEKQAREHTGGFRFVGCTESWWVKALVDPDEDLGIVSRVSFGQRFAGLYLTVNDARVKTRPLPECMAGTWT